MENSKNAGSNHAMMNISFLKDDPLNSLIVDSKDGKPLYDVHTPGKASKLTTTIRRLKSGVISGEGETIAEVQWHKLGFSTITLQGITVRVKDWLRKDGIFSSSRLFTASDGNQYKWSHDSGNFTLKNTNTNVEAAKSHRAKTGWFDAPRKMNIDIFSHGIYILDTIVASFIIMEEKDRRAKAVRSTIMIVGNGNTVAATS